MLITRYRHTVLPLLYVVMYVSSSFEGVLVLVGFSDVTDLIMRAL
jgi:hypothetical protein